MSESRHGEDLTLALRPSQSFEKILTAPSATLSSLPGLGDKKVKRLRDAFTAPFQLNAGKKRKVQVERTSEAARRGERGEGELN